ncbi:glycoside hydrolase family 130 protein [Ilumatobacter sp.]|uniref:glycoside hydrolase family 130 protein n=1 Tax=Ilumatobacter sp. TaxID=1967498 RepID=UPI003B5260ED
MTRQDGVHLVPDPSRVITKPFVPNDEPDASGSSRLGVVLARVMAMSDDEVASALAETRSDFADRHRDFDDVLARHHALVATRPAARGALDAPTSAERRLLLGAYCTHEYSVEAAALGNPSIVAAPDQSDVEDGSLRVVISLRAIGEGHLSSIEFRTGVVGADGSLELDPVSPYAETGVRAPHDYDKRFFTTKLGEVEMLNDVEERVLARLDDRFTMEELEGAIASLDDDGIERTISGETTRFLHLLASSNYRVSFPPTRPLSERVLFPSGPTESRGMEDARFVRFVDDDGSARYLATYTAFDGHKILPQLIETLDFTDFRIRTLTGAAASNKGIAIFPRRIDGRFVALGRQDNTNNFVMRSDELRSWSEATLIQEPKRPWELVQLGNCGSPVETEAGWLVITHGVGPMRRYTLGALLLDLDDPTRVLGHLREPLLAPTDDEREGYVPNVVYSCGSLIHGDHLVVPYGFADVGARIATIRVDEVLDRLSHPER